MQVKKQTRLIKFRKCLIVIIAINRLKKINLACKPKEYNSIFDVHSQSQVSHKFSSKSKLNPISDLLSTGLNNILLGLKGFSPETLSQTPLKFLKSSKIMGLY